jgi:hypothetical protein
MGDAGRARARPAGFRGPVPGRRLPRRGHVSPFPLRKVSALTWNRGNLDTRRGVSASSRPTREDPEGVEPGALSPAGNALEALGWLRRAMEADLLGSPPLRSYSIACVGDCGRVMRHAESLPVGALPDSMPHAASQTRLIPPSGGTLLATTMILSAGITTEALPTVTVFADRERPPASFVAADKEPEHAETDRGRAYTRVLFDLNWGAPSGAPRSFFRAFFVVFPREETARHLSDERGRAQDRAGSRTHEASRAAAGGSGRDPARRPQRPPSGTPFLSSSLARAAEVQARRTPRGPERVEPSAPF